MRHNVHAATCFRVPAYETRPRVALVADMAPGDHLEANTSAQTGRYMRQSRVAEKHTWPSLFAPKLHATYAEILSKRAKKYYSIKILPRLKIGRLNEPPLRHNARSDKKKIRFAYQNSREINRDSKKLHYSQ